MFVIHFATPINVRISLPNEHQKKVTTYFRRHSRPKRAGSRACTKEIIMHILTHPVYHTGKSKRFTKQQKKIVLPHFHTSHTGVIGTFFSKR